MPRGPVAEFPFYDRRIDFHIHTRYMLNSTAHWQPLLNGYSDHIPADFRALAPILATFPSEASFDALKDRRVRYITLNRGRQGYGARDVAGDRAPHAAVPAAPAGGRRRWGCGDLRSGELAEVSSQLVSFAVCGSQFAVRGSRLASS